MPRLRQPSLDSASRRPQTAAVLVVLTIEDDPDGHSLADAVRILCDEFFGLPPRGDE